MTSEVKFIGEANNLSVVMRFNSDLMEAGIREVNEALRLLK